MQDKNEIIPIHSMEIEFPLHPIKNGFLCGCMGHLQDKKTITGVVLAKGRQGASNG